MWNEAIEWHLLPGQGPPDWNKNPNAEGVRCLFKVRQTNSVKDWGLFRVRAGTYFFESRLFHDHRTSCEYNEEQVEAWAFMPTGP